MRAFDVSTIVRLLLRSMQIVASSPGGSVIAATGTTINQ
jgi:hypothetical protein